MVNYRVLGPLTIVDGDVHSIPSATRQRQLLALLLLNANNSVPVETCVAELWEDDPPKTATTTLQTYVLQLRRILAALPSIGSQHEAKKRLTTQPGSYQLRLAEDDTVDAHTFRTLVDSARTAIDQRNDICAAVLLRRALELWEGEPLLGVQTGPRLRAWAVGLAAQRLTTIEQRVEADLRIGMHHELIGDLSSLIVEYPTNENLHAQLMIALYRSGRPAQALSVMARLHDTLDVELGLDPSPRMRDLHQAVLSSSPTLDVEVEWAGAPLSLNLMSGTRRTPIGASVYDCEPALREALAG
ncbi:AfsR/SARP family transcriptional regulator [Flexivirga sp. ID2601S]|uniref:AfsR/SARP family transcriptional regulator n=1 Tax=Flexivirga aerilata TaxID=1656889 RepID=A0A849AN92_9MICO|nr:AfsR/SARP family transcriptional regulator [Flexivirga aerilata]NNG38272.1 AfsR/SARP family transcriptional regulator [Flexivirga aerilata]